MSWIEFWDGQPTIYVSARHKQAHYRLVADGLIEHLGESRPAVLDYGCGEALFAADVARRCTRLYLCDAAPSVRADLARRFAGSPEIVVLAPEQQAKLAPRSVDLIVANSVVQYLPVDVLDVCLREWARLLAPGGRLLLADVIPPSVGPLTDALALLKLARREGFFLAACAGLVRTFFSSYRKIRSELGLRQFEEPEILALLSAHGFDARRHHPNLGHNQARMAFVAEHRTTRPAPHV